MHRTLCLEEAGKLNSVQPNEAQAVTAPISYRLNIIDRCSGIKFLIDTGAGVSVIPRGKHKTRETSTKLYAANGTEIRTYGERTLRMNLGLRRSYIWNFIIADVKMAILGADFLARHNILVDLGRRRLIDNLTNVTSIASVDTSDEPSIKLINGDNPFAKLLEEFPNITRSNILPNHEVKHKVKHFIETNGPPVYARARPLPPDKYALVKKEFQKLIDLNICRPSSSPWASPLHCVKKKNGELRLCGDYRRLNNITVPDRFPIPRLQDFTYVLHGMKMFTKIDLVRAFNQIPMNEADIVKTAIITPFGLFENLKCSFGLRNSAQTFQRFMNVVLQGLDNVFCYIDDILIASKNEKEHQEHVRTVLKRLDDNGITINVQKCEFKKTTVEYLGYQVDEKGITPLAERTQVISEFKRPDTVQQLRRFLGMVNFYRESTPHAAKHQAQLNKYLIGAKKNDKTSITWNDVSSQAFQECKDAVKAAITLAHPAPEAQLFLASDASDTGVGATLEQRIDGKLQPLGFFSKNLNETQRKYSTYDRELLGIYLATKHFRRLIEGRDTTICTDHKPIIYAFGKNANTKNEIPRRVRQLDYIAQFCNNIQHIPGEKNSVADWLSRIEAISCPNEIDYNELALSQEKDQEAKGFLRQNDTVKKIHFPGVDKPIICDTVNDQLRPFLTQKFREIAFKIVHGIAHPGIRGTRNLITQRFIWPRMHTDIKLWTQACIACQKAKVTRHTRTQLEKFDSAGRFDHIHIDFVGPLQIAQGCRYVLTIIDRATHWLEAVPLPDQTAETTAKALYENWITRYGCPERITSDQGANFESNLFRQLTQVLGIKKLRTTSFHPIANGILERAHRTLKAAIMARQNSVNWIDEMPTVLLGMRAAVRQDTGTSAAELTFGRTLRLPGEFIAPTEERKMDATFVDRLQQHLSDLAAKPTRQYKRNNVFVHPDLEDCTHIFLRDDQVRRPLQPPYLGPYPVITRTNKTYEVTINNKKRIVSADRVKPAFYVSPTNDDNTRAEPTSTSKQNQSSSPDNKMPTTTTKTNYVTRSGRTIKKTVKFSE